MALSLDTAIKFTAKLEGQGLDQLKRGLQGMAQQANRSSKDLDQLYNANKKLSQAAGQSINSLNRQVQVLTNLRNEAALGSRQFKFYSAELEKLQRQQARLTGTTQGGGGLLAMGGGLGGLAAAAGGGLAIKFIADAGLQAESAQVRLQALTNEFGEYAQAQESVARISKTLRVSTLEASQAFSNLYNGLRANGVTIKEIEDAYIGIAAASRAAGGSAAKTQELIYQVTQALQSGVLQGDELRKIREEAPALLRSIAKEMSQLKGVDIGVGQLKELGSQGEITADVVLRAAARLKNSELTKLGPQFQTGAQALVDLQNELRRTAEGIAKAFGPTAIAFLRGFTQALQRVSDGLGLVDGAAERREDRIRADIQAQREASQKFGIGGFFRYGFEIDRFQNQRAEELFAQFQAERQRRAQAGQRDNPTADQREAREAAAAEREAARQRAREEALKDELKIRKDTEEKLGDAAQRRAEQLADFQRDTIKRAAELERDLGDERLKLERSIGEVRRRIAAQEQDAALEAERQRLSAAGLSTEGIDAARELGEISRRYSEQRIENEQNATDRQVQLQRQLEEFKTSVAEGIGKIQEGYARSVSNILQDAGEKLAEKMRQGAQDAATTLGGAGGGAPGALGPNRLMPGSVGRGQLKVGQLKALAMAAGFNDRDASIMAAIAMAESGGRSAAHNDNVRTGDNSYGLWQVNMLGRMGPERRRQFGIGSNEALFDPAVNASAARKVFESQGFGAWSVFRSGAYKQFLPGAMRAQAGAPPASMLPGRPGAAVPGFNSAGLMGGLQRAGQQLSGAIGTEKALNDQQAFNDFFDAYLQKFGEYKQDLNGVNTAAKQQLADQQRMYELMRSGLSPELAQQRVDAENTAASEARRLQELEKALDKELQRTDLTEQQRLKLKDLRAEVIARQMNEKGITEEILAQQLALESLQEAEEKRRRAIDAFASSIGNGLGQVFDLLASGTDDWGASLKEIASGVLKDIAKQLFQIYVIEAAIKALKGILRGGTDAAGNFVPKISGFADGGVMTSSGPAPLKKYSQGGIANRPQLALYGEGSKPEAYVPLPDGRRIPVALQGQDKMREVMGAGPAQGAASPVLNMSFQTTNIGGVEYVSRDQLEAAMAETRRAASRDGAKRGMTMTLDKLQQSPSTRTRVGLR